MIGVALPTTGYPGCALYGGTSYTSAFLGINYLVILTGFAIVSFVYMLSRFLPGSLSGKLSGVTKVEFVELVISAVIIGIVLVFASVACGITYNISQSVTGSGSSPLIFADSYIANLTFNTGLGLLTHIYSFSISYALAGSMYGYVSNLLSSYLLKEEPTGALLGISVAFPVGNDIGGLYSILSDMFAGVLAPLVITALGMLFVQWLSLPIIEATAFVIVLPVAIAMRAFAYAAAGGGLRQAANSILAIAIAAYIVYPTAIAFDPWIINWIYGPANPSYQYLPSYTVTSVPPGVFSGLGGGAFQTPGFLIQIPGVSELLAQTYNLGLPTDPFSAANQLAGLINEVAQFFFIGVFLFAIDLGITIAFAMGLARALNSGIEGETRFWS